eukprot:jgi/Undpi1/13230/HiC_scaffold_8.g02892.m1
MEEKPEIIIARRRIQAKRKAAEEREAAEAAAAAAAAAAATVVAGTGAHGKGKGEGQNGHGKGGRKRKLGEGLEAKSDAAGKNAAVNCEEVVVTPPAPEDLIATYVLAKGQAKIVDILQQLSNELKLPLGSETRLRLLGVGNSEINAVAEREEEAQRFLATRATQNVAGPILKLLHMGSILLEMADDEEMKATSGWGKTPPPEGEPAPPPWMPIQRLGLEGFVGGREGGRGGGGGGGAGFSSIWQTSRAPSAKRCEGGEGGSLLWRLLSERFPHYVNKGLEDHPLPHGKFPTLGFKKVGCRTWFGLVWFVSICL